MVSRPTFSARMTSAPVWFSAAYDRFADYARHRHGSAGHHRFIDR
jgi:hypothetical protein